MNEGQRTQGIEGKITVTNPEIPGGFLFVKAPLSSESSIAIRHALAESFAEQLRDAFTEGSDTSEQTSLIRQILDCITIGVNGIEDPKHKFEFTDRFLEVTLDPTDPNPARPLTIDLSAGGYTLRPSIAAYYKPALEGYLVQSFMPFYEDIDRGDFHMRQNYSPLDVSSNEVLRRKLEERQFTVRQREQSISYS